MGAVLVGFVHTSLEGAYADFPQLVVILPAKVIVPILKTKIRLSTTVAETPAVRKTLFQYKPNNKASVDYQELAKEVMELYGIKETANGCG